VRKRRVGTQRVRHSLGTQYANSAERYACIVCGMHTYTGMKLVSVTRKPMQSMA
jgi:hypothetical protein